MLIACLHTAESNIAVFEAAAQPLGATLTHMVRADLLREAEVAGGLNPDTARRTAFLLRGLADHAEAVLLTCSTLGPAALDAAHSAKTPILRVDDALARQALEAGRRITVLCAAQTTIEPTRALFKTVASGRAAAIEIQLVPGAWDVFKTGEIDRYHAMVADAADAAFEAGADVVALAQASMAHAASLCQAGRPLTSPTAGLAAALQAAATAR
jgi:Asp/Glu/hydantoin racemase